MIKHAKPKTNLAVNLGGLEMNNPFTVASGTFASGMEYAALWAQSYEQDNECALHELNELNSIRFYPQKPLSMLGAITTKGVSLKQWPGNKGTRITETASGMLNSIGLQNPGVKQFIRKDLSWLSLQELPIIVNVSGHTSKEYAEVIKQLDGQDCIDAYEINISCPNVDSGVMSFGTDKAAALEVVKTCRELTRRPMIVKLTPNVTDICEIAKACVDGGADALSLINTVAGMAVDATLRRAVFDRKVAGLSGPAIKPVALLATYNVSRAVNVPILAMGGIVSGLDVAEFILAGATAVALGTANFGNPMAVPTAMCEFINWCDAQGVKDVAELVGAIK